MRSEVKRAAAVTKREIKNQWGHLDLVQPAIGWMRENPEEFRERMEDFDGVLAKLTAAKTDPEMDTESMKNVQRLRQVKGGLLQFPPIQGIVKLAVSQAGQSESAHSYSVIEHVRETFTDVEKLIASWDKDWDFPLHVEPSELVGRLQIHGYGLFAEKHNKVPQLAGVFVPAFLEKLIMDKPNSALSKGVLPLMRERSDSFAPAVKRELTKIEASHLL